MLKKLYLLIVVLLVASCATPKMIMVGNVTLRDTKGEIVSYYPKSHIINQVGEGDQVTNIRFITQDGVEHYIENGYISVDAVEYIQERNNRTYVVVDSYPYWYYRNPYVITYPYRYYRPVPVRPQPRPTPRPIPRTQLRPRR